VTSKNSARVFILHSGSLLASGLEIILKEEGLAATGIDVSTQSLDEEMLHFKRGDIVVFDTADVGVHPSLSLLQILMQTPAVVMIGLDPIENRMEIYRKSERRMHKTADLLKLIQAR
jgi:hypothetical protein